MSARPAVQKWQFTADVIKVDKSFIDRIGANDGRAPAVIDAVLQMANRLDMVPVAEGIKTGAKQLTSAHAVARSVRFLQPAGRWVQSPCTA